jgi:hypothetical protein
MKGPLRLILLLGVFALAWIPCGSRPSLLQGAPKEFQSSRPNMPPPAMPATGQPPEVHPRAPRMPPDFLDNPKDHKRNRKKVDPAQAQKDAEALATLAKKVQEEVDQLSKNILSKDLDQDLKHIEKLAKRLRGEITP